MGGDMGELGIVIGLLPDPVTFGVAVAGCWLARRWWMISPIAFAVGLINALIYRHFRGYMGEQFLAYGIAVAHIHMLLAGGIVYALSGGHSGPVGLRPHLIPLSILVGLPGLLSAALSAIAIRADAPPQNMEAFAGLALSTAFVGYFGYCGFLILRGLWRLLRGLPWNSAAMGLANASGASFEKATRSMQPMTTALAKSFSEGRDTERKKTDTDR